jgi:aspartate kinase
MIVMKFGGTSVESVAAIERLGAIVRSRRARQPIVVVVSAMGKTTNRLLEMAGLAVAGKRDEAMTKFAEWRTYTDEIANHFDVWLDTEYQELQESLRALAVLGELTPRLWDHIVSFGERISAQVVAKALNATHADARQFLVTDNRHSQAQPNYAATNERLKNLPQAPIVVMGGFIGATENGVTSTLGRGGSDFTASIVGAALDAEEIQIWTDVDGMLTADPRILAGGHRVKTISFTEAAELAYFGAKVLHPSTVLPAVEKNIPVRILNSRRPENEGTLIVAQAVACKNPVKSIACKTGIALVNIQSTRMLMAHGFLRRIFEIFDRFETPVDMVATSEVSVSLTIDNLSRLDSIVAELSAFSEVTVERDAALVCVVGENIRATPGVGARIFQAIAGINVRMISQGASLVNLSFAVGQADLAETVARLHRELFAELDPNVFE